MTLLLYAQKCDQYDQYNKIAPSALADFFFIWNEIVPKLILTI